MLYNTGASSLNMTQYILAPRIVETLHVPTSPNIKSLTSQLHLSLYYKHRNAKHSDFHTEQRTYNALSN
jgi:hypothetical protein